MVLDEFPAVRLKLTQIGVDRVQNRRQRLTGNDDLVLDVSGIGDPVEGSKVPVRIVEHEVLEERNANLCVMVGLLRRRRFRRDAERPAIGFTASLKGRVIIVLVHDLIRTGPDVFDCFHLLSRKAGRRLLRALAQELLGIVVAQSRIVQHAIHYAVEGVACGIHGIAEKRVLSSENSTGRIR